MAGKERRAEKRVSWILRSKYSRQIYFWLVWEPTSKVSKETGSMKLFQRTNQVRRGGQRRLKEAREVWTYQVSAAEASPAKSKV